MKAAILTIQVLFCLIVSTKTTFAQPISKTFPLKWKTKIGVTTYRSNMICDQGKLYIGSNGRDRNLMNDSLDGVYAIDIKNGKILRKFKPYMLGDNDVNGVILDGDRIFFGSDNYHFYCYDKNSSELKWTYNCPYDVEGTPVLSKINSDDINDVVVNIEGSGLVALDGKDGKVIWGFSASSGNGNSSPAVYDLNSDGTKDFLYGGYGVPSNDDLDGAKRQYYGHHFYAVDGKTGNTLWANEAESGIHAAPVIVETSNGPLISYSECYGAVHFLDRNGNEVYRNGMGGGLYGSTVFTSTSGSVVAGQAWPYSEEGSVVITPLKGELKADSTTAEFNTESTKDHLASLFSATPLVADILGKNSLQIFSISENGKVFILQENGEKIMEMDAPAGAEATPLIMDTDGNGTLEILISCLDGNLYCYQTNSKGKVVWGSYRGDMQNSGVLHAKNN